MKIFARYVGLLSVALLLSLSAALAQDVGLKNVLDKLEKYNATHITEKIHVQTDRPYYSIGDTIWFKAYLVLGHNNRLSLLSKYMYVDLINEKDSIKKTLKLKLINGTGKGDFVLSDSLREGNYRLRAYTTWMRNQSDAFFFDKTFSVGNILSNKIIGSATYLFSKTGIKENVTANLLYADINGVPLVNKEVSYTIQLDYRNVLTGKGQTDNAGKLQIKFTNAQPFVLKSGKISTTLKLDEKNRIGKIFPIKSTSDEVDVQFFPEGGNLVAGIRSRVALKATGADGLGRSIKGVVIDAEKNRISEFAVQHAGMGAFSFLPEANKQYQALVQFDDGSEKLIPLPTVQQRGYVLNINNAYDDKLIVKVYSNIPEVRNGDLTIVAATNGEVSFVSKMKLIEGVLSGSIPKSRFRPGILQLTLFDPAFLPIAERLVFIPQPEFKMAVNTDKAVYGKREKVNVTIAAADSLKNDIALLSLAVYNEAQLPFDENAETTILSSLLLSSDIKGYIEKPNYYFTAPITEEKRNHLDILLLTQGWRRYTWTDILKENYPPITYPAEDQISISGRVVNANGSPLPEGKVILLPAKGNGVIMDTLTNKEGRFVFDHLNFNDSTSFVIQARNAKGKRNVFIELDRQLPETVSKNKNLPDLQVNVNESLLAYLKKRAEDFDEMRRNGLIRKSIMLSEVKISQKKPILTNSSNLNGAGNADAIIKAEQLQNCMSLAQCLQGMVAGLIVQNGVAYLTRSMYSSFSGLVPMQLILDGMYVDPTFLSMIPPQDVESIEVLKGIGNTAIYGMRGGGGVLIINTKRGEPNYSSKSLAPGIATFKPQGIYAARQFYAPVYNIDKEAKPLPDRRKTLYWNADMMTDKDGLQRVQFYTGDDQGSYRLILEGISLSGRIIRTVQHFSVQ